MFLIYPLVCLLLSLTHRLFRNRADRAEKHFADAGSTLAEALQNAAPKPGETYAMKFHRERGLLQISERHDRAAAKALAWERRRDKVGSVRDWMATTLGKTFGYCCGCLDWFFGTAGLVSYGLGVEPGTAFDWAWNSLRYWAMG